MEYKNGVFIQVIKYVGNERVKLNPSIAIENAMLDADAISKQFTGKEIVITSVLDGKHSRNSKHYTGNAFDIRVWIYTEYQITHLTRLIQKELGKDYDVVFEGDHIHIEYDPK